MVSRNLKKFVLSKDEMKDARQNSQIGMII